MTNREYFKQVAKLSKKIGKKLGVVDIKVLGQISMDGVTGDISYAAQYSSPADGVAPLTFLKDSPEAVIDAIKKQIKEYSPELLEIAYHEAQANHAQNTSTSHQKIVEELKATYAEKEVSRGNKN